MSTQAEPRFWPTRTRGRHRARGRSQPQHRAGRSWPAFDAIGSILLIALLAFSTFVAYGTVVDNRWYKILAIQGGSMQPTIGAGDAIVITRPPEQIDADMVLTFEVDGQIVTHRVIDVQGDRLLTRGDANDALDEWDGRTSDVRGQYRFRLPWLGYFIGG